MVRTLRWTVSCAAAATVFSASSAAADLGNLQGILGGMQAGSWAQVNLNAFDSVYPDLADRPLAGTSYANPDKVIGAWSSFAWDSRRGDLILFGGGHGNYAGNEVYRWHGGTQRWELSSLPSNVTGYAVSGGTLYVRSEEHTSELQSH